MKAVSQRTRQPTSAASGPGRATPRPRPLPRRLRAGVEALGGVDLSAVKVFPDSPEPEAVGALAYARGTEIHLAPGQERHLPHEVWHVAQQLRGEVRARRTIAGLPVNDSHALEREASFMGARAARLGATAMLDRPAPSGERSPGGGPVVQGVWVNMTHGKVSADWTTPRHPPAGAPAGHVWMDEGEFVRWKNAGKRTPSSKVTDRTTGTSYYRHASGALFTDKALTHPAPPISPANLVDRSRPDRTGAPVSLYDVLPYAEAKRRERAGDAMEHDHVVAGESMKRRVGKETHGFDTVDPMRAPVFSGGGGAPATMTPEWAYAHAPSIEIRGRGHPEGWDHKDFSPTWGSRQQRQDTLALPGGGAFSARRPDMDAERPHVAFHRDVDVMLASTAHRPDALEQGGAYRTLYRQNAKLGHINPAAPAYAVHGNPLTGGVTYSPHPIYATQGDATDAMLTTELRKHLADPGP